MRDIECGHIKKKSRVAEDDYAKLAHYVWRLGATRAHASKVVEAVIAVPSLKHISGLHTVTAPPTSKTTIERLHMSPHELLHGIFAEWASQNPTEYEPAFNKLHHRDQPPVRPLYTHMRSRTSIVTRVHAELQIADKFSRSKFKLAGDDKYIGCSKPACYFCYNWLSCHKDFYVQPATHHNIIPGCRAPDGDLNQVGANIVLETCSKISRRIGQDIVESLKQDEQPRHQYMSTEAPSQATSVFPGIIS